jgi:hypothetical protein
MIANEEFTSAYPTGISKANASADNSSVTRGTMTEGSTITSLQ